jgi:TetR/AcrR family transcriptional repressor of nem operon
MRVTREKAAENRDRIVETAARLFRDRGFDGVGVDTIMKGAGLTHGGFYGHFKSKDELIAETLAYAFEPGESAGDLAAFTKRYLSPRHRDDFAGGCSTAGLAAETIRQAPAVRTAMTAGLSDTIARFSRQTAGETAAERRRNAIGRWAAMVGALVLARSSDDAALSDEILSATQAWLEEKEERIGPAR